MKLVKVLPYVGMADLDPPEKISAKLEVSMGGAKPLPLKAVALQAVVGVAKLYVPKSLQV